jgi:hypothetical protein
MAEWLAGIPLFWGKIIAVLALAGMVVWTWIRPKDFVMRGAPDSHRWRDLRIWASLLLAVQVVLYLSF